MRPARTRAKLGVALSGGGFRAALFHLGVLAHLAEVGLLRHVEVLSTVSGGSIVGALYYIHLKELLEAKPDHAVTDNDYRAIVLEVEAALLYGVQKNLRMRTFANPFKNWQMRRPEYTRSHRMGELYEEYFFRPVLKERTKGGIPMHRLKIFPYGESDGFHPRRDNARRSAKVPILLLNATSLNTGRNWRFEASRMGEPPRLDRQALEIDKVTRLLRPPTYSVLPGELQKVSLGTAVAASTAVPGLFHPLAISRMYPDRAIALVDGGVHDNQGIQGLLDEGCNRLVISDASGPMDEEPSPDSSVASVLLRTNSVMMYRLREEQLRSTLGDTQADRNVGLIHTQDGLAIDMVPWLGEEQVQRKEGTHAATHGDGSGSGVHPTVQRLLARIRTDLDSFTEVEAFSLMHLGYTLSRRTLAKRPGLGELCSRRTPVRWRFLQVGPWMQSPTREYMRQLEVGGESLFKVFRMAPGLRRLMLGGALMLLTVLCGRNWEALLSSRSLTISWAGWQVILAALSLLGLPLIKRAIRIRRVWCWARRPAAWLYRLLFQTLLPTMGALFVQLYLLTLDPLFLRMGRIERLDPPRPPSQVIRRKDAPAPADFAKPFGNRSRVFVRARRFL